MRFNILKADKAQQAADLQQVLFINQADDPQLNDFFSREYDRVVELFRQYDYDFVFLPKLLTGDFLANLISYNRPDLCGIDVSDFNENFSISEFYDMFTKGSEETSHVGLLSANEMSIEPFETMFFQSNSLIDGPVSQYLFADLYPGSDDEIWEQLDNYFQYRNPKRYEDLHTVSPYNDEVVVALNDCSVLEEEVYDSDERFPEEAFQLTQEIKANIKKLRAMGVNELLIRDLFVQELTISRLRITKDFRFLLTDYENMEIKIGPLPKALYLLFLRHPEGIIFKEISNYRQELFVLYRLVSNREADSDMRESIMQITNPCCNSLNENCSRIRQAFLKEMNDAYAQNYYIMGLRATPKRIRLDRDLVVYDDEIVSALQNVNY